MSYGLVFVLIGYELGGQGASLDDMAAFMFTIDDL